MKKGIFLIPVLVTCMVVFGGYGDKDNDFRDTWLGTYEGYCEYLPPLGLTISSTQYSPTRH